jgi:hypothetical protein
MIEGMVRGDARAEALVWNWAWPASEFESIVSSLPKKNIRLMAVSESMIEFTRGGVSAHVRDYSISVVGPGKNAKKMWSLARENGLGAVAKVQANCSWELSPFPYLPIMDLPAEHACNIAKEGVRGVMLSWSLGCCPAPNLRIFRDLRAGETSPDALLDRLAVEMYGDKAARARKAWKAFSDGYREYPFHVAVLYNGPQQWGWPIRCT